jgi:DNA-binding response OmpR family regulator
MPGLDAYDMVRAVRAEPGLAATRMVVVVSSARGADRSAGLDAGADDIMELPLDLDELERRIRRARRRSTAR